MVRPTLIDLNPVGLSYYPFMISQDKCNESCIAVDDLSTKICVTSETKHCIKYARIRVFSDPYSSVYGR